MRADSTPRRTGSASVSRTGRRDLHDIAPSRPCPDREELRASTRSASGEWSCSRSQRAGSWLRNWCLEEFRWRPLLGHSPLAWLAYPEFKQVLERIPGRSGMAAAVAFVCFSATVIVGTVTLLLTAI